MLPSAVARAGSRVVVEGGEGAWQVVDDGLQLQLGSVDKGAATRAVPLEGVDMAGRSLAGAPHFFPGAAVNPAAEPFDLVLQKVRKKIDSGARFFQTQAVFRRSELERLSAAVAPIDTWSSRPADDGIESTDAG